MTARQHAGFWLGFFVIFCILVYLLRDMLLPFVVGMAVAYLTDPITDRLEAWGLSRIQATTVITAAFFVIFIAGVLVLVPLLVRQAAELLEQLPVYLERGSNLLQPLMRDVVEAAQERGVKVTPSQGAEALKSYAQQAVEFFAELAGDVLRGGVALLNFLSLLVITPIVAFYLLLDWDRIVARIDGWLPKRYADDIRRLAGEIDRTLAGFVRGQGAVCLTLMVYYTLGLSASGLDFGVIIGLLSGALSFIPFVGAIFGGVTSIGLAVVQFWPDDVLRIVIVAAIYIVGQVLEGYVLTPKLVGDRVGLHPVWVMFGVLAGGVLFGFVGMLLALPVSAVIGVLVRFGLERYLASRYYDPDNPS